MACSLMNDSGIFCKINNTPLYVCSLDAETCFDKIWHNGLFYKVHSKLPLDH